MKSGDFSSSWGGIAGVQSTLAVLLERGCHERPCRSNASRLSLSRSPLADSGIRNKGSLDLGNDADLMLDGCQGEFRLAADDLHQRHKLSPYLGHPFVAPCGARFEGEKQFQRRTISRPRAPADSSGQLG